MKQTCTRLTSCKVVFGCCVQFHSIEMKATSSPFVCDSNSHRFRSLAVGFLSALKAIDCHWKSDSLENELFHFRFESLSVSRWKSFSSALKDHQLGGERVSVWILSNHSIWKMLRREVCDWRSAHWTFWRAMQQLYQELLISKISYIVLFLKNI